MPMDAKTFKKIKYSEIYQCEQCSHGQLLPLPPPEKIPTFYELDKYYTQGESHFKNYPLNLLDKLLTKIAWVFDEGIDFRSSNYIENLPQQSIVCEIGCGHGKNLIGFNVKGIKVIGVDPDQKAVETAKKNGIEVLLGTAENLPESIKENSVDLVLMSHSLEHCLNPRVALANASKILKPGGIFICEVPNSGCTHFIWNNVCSEMLDVPRHLHFFSATSLKKAIETAELKIETEQYCGFTRHHAKDWRSHEANIHQELSKLSTNQLPPKHTFFRSLMLWAVTFMASPEKKYDSIRIIAKKI